MRIGFYPKLALDGIRKNKRMYLPYILTGCIMVMMFYILSYLVESPALEQMIGGSTLGMVLNLGSFVIAVFSLLFLFYTNSFLIKQRYREFGLYNVLGMNKKNICRLMIWETVYIGFTAILVGLAAGIVMSKAAELLVLNILKLKVTFAMSIGIKALLHTMAVYGLIYLLLLVYSFIRVKCSKPLELLQSSKAGESVPKYTWSLAACGLVLLAVAYYLSVSIKEPLTAMLLFFVAVIMVIAGTYLLFIAGSVVFCRMLQKNKAYYYQPNHFVSVSSMVYRMKRNGAGLASICILLTMVLVMISSTCCLYFGVEDSIQNRYPYSVNVSVTYDNVEGISDENISYLQNEIMEYAGSDAELIMTRSAQIPGVFTKEGITIDEQNVGGLVTTNYDNVGQLYVISLEDYNETSGNNEKLAENECLIYTDRIKFVWDDFDIEYGGTYKVKETLDEFNADSDFNAMIMPTVYMVVDDLNSFCKPLHDIKSSSDDSMIMYSYSGGFDADSEHKEEYATKEIQSFFGNLAENDDSGITQVSIRSRDAQREGFYDLYGSLFFLGIMLSIVFLIAAVLIIYYKQISEGYEDYARFDIMQKVGMTKRDIRQSINSQMLTVFFLPLILAGVHLSFAFPFITRIFVMFAFDNTTLSIIVNLVCFVVFGIFYGLVYKITSGAYYAIVSGERGV